MNPFLESKQGWDLKRLIEHGYKLKGDLSELTLLQIEFLLAIEDEERARRNLQAQKALRKEFDKLL